METAIIVIGFAVLIFGLPILVKFLQKQFHS